MLWVASAAHQHVLPPCCFMLPHAHPQSQILVVAGFSVEETDTTAAGKRVRHSSYMPPAGWQLLGPNEW
jgi:hypothetical protein